MFRGIERGKIRNGSMKVKQKVRKILNAEIPIWTKYFVVILFILLWLGHMSGIFEGNKLW